MELKVIPGEFAICKVKDLSQINLEQEFLFLGKTNEEISLVCPACGVPQNPLCHEPGWRAFRIEGVLDFSLTGILASLSSQLAESGIGIFAISTYNTDYILTKSESFEQALLVLEREGHRILR